MKKNIVNIARFNMRTFNMINQLPKLTASAAEHNIDILCMQEHRYYYSELELKCYNTDNRWTFVLASAWKNCQWHHRRCRNVSQSLCLKITH